MKLAAQMKKIAKNNKKSDAKRVIDLILSKIEVAAEDGRYEVDVQSFYLTNKGKRLTDREIGTVRGTLKRMRFKLKNAYDPESQAYYAEFVVSWK